jgi:hypothetical protein
MIYLGHWERTNEYNYFQGHKHIVIPNSPLGTHAYILNRKGIKKIFENFKVDQHLDMFYSEMIKRLKIECFGFNPPLVIQKDFSSDIQSDSIRETLKKLNIIVKENERS